MRHPLGPPEPRVTLRCVCGAPILTVAESVAQAFASGVWRCGACPKTRKE